MIHNHLSPLVPLFVNVRKSFVSAISWFTLTGSPFFSCDFLLWLILMCIGGAAVFGAC